MHRIYSYRKFHRLLKHKFEWVSIIACSSSNNKITWSNFCGFTGQTALFGMLINTKRCQLFPFFLKSWKSLLRIIELCRPKIMRLTFWELVAMAAFILLSSSRFVKAGLEEDFGEMTTWARRFCNITTNYGSGMSHNLLFLQQELHEGMQQFDLDLAGYIQSTFCFADEQTAESITRDLHYVWEGLTCLKSSLQIISTMRVHGTLQVACDILNDNKNHLNDAITDVRTLALTAQRLTFLPHLLRSDDCSLWRDYSQHFLHLSYSFVNRSLTLARNLETLCFSSLN